VDYPGGSKVFTFKDAHKNELTGIDNLFAAGAYVKVILDVNNASAYIQNADTNAYIERTFAKTVNGVTPDSTGNVEWLPTPSEIGAGIDVKLLWEGSWKSDRLPVPNTNKYTGFQIGMSGQGTTILAMKYGTHIRGMGGYTDKDGKVTTYHFTATFSGNEWTWVGCDSFYHYANGQHSTNTSNTVSRIYGVF
jgi:hypothetical protein